MKKLAKIFGVMAVVLCLGVSLMACTTGTYKYEIKAGEMSMTTSIKLKSGGKCEMTVKGEAGGQKVNETTKGTYKLDGEKITLTFEAPDGGEDMVIEGTLKGKSLKIDMGAGEVEFKT